MLTTFKYSHYWSRGCTDEKKEYIISDRKKQIAFTIIIVYDRSLSRRLYRIIELAKTKSRAKFPAYRALREVRKTM